MRTNQIFGQYFFHAKIGRITYISLDQKYVTSFKSCTDLNNHISTCPKAALEYFFTPGCMFIKLVFIEVGAGLFLIQINMYSLDPLIGSQLLIGQPLLQERFVTITILIMLCVILLDYV